jgi:hypothetical protein
MATSFNRFSNSASVASAPVVSSLDATIANAVANNQLVFKLELNANPSKVLTAKADGKYESTITNLGGCGAMRRNNKTGLVFFSVNSRPMIKDKTLGHVVNTAFTLPLYHLTSDIDEAVLAQNKALAAYGLAPLPVSGSLVENHVNSEKLAALLFAVYGANSAMLYFNDNRKDVFFDEDLQEIMASESGLLTVFFALDETSVSPELIDVYGVPTPRLNCKIIAANFEAGKATYIPQPRNVAPAFRLAKGLAILNEQYDSNFNAHGNLELSESFFAGIESKRDEFLAGIGTGKKAHQQFKKALQESVDAGNWNKDAEYKLYAIARRGTNPHYSMKNHDAFVAQLRAQVGDDVVIIEAATPVAVETKVEAMATILESAAAAVEDDEEDDYGFVATVNPSAFLSSASQASDLEINI